MQAGLIPCCGSVCQRCDGLAGSAPVLGERQFETYQQARVRLDKIGLQEGWRAKPLDGVGAIVLPRPRHGR